MLRVKDLSINYNSVRAVKNISFEVMENEVVSLIGANGAGKTSILLGISNMISKDSGEILFRGKDISYTPNYEIATMGISHVPEGRNIFPDLTVEENLIMGNSSTKKFSKKDLKSKLEEQFVLFPRLRERKEQRGGTLSGGEQQMLAIARGMMGDPEFLMLDEPTLGLAPLLIDEIFDLILKIRSMGKTVLVIEQNANMSLAVSDRAYVLERGEIILSGKSQIIIDDPAIQTAYLGI